MPPRKYPLLLPALPPVVDGDGEVPSSSQPKPESIAKRTRIATPIACQECRTRKIRCDGGQPRCSNCAKKGYTSCVYSETRTKAQNAIAVLDLLCSLPENQAFDLLRNVREKGYAHGIIPNSHSSDANMPDCSSSPLSAELSVSRPTESTLMSELTVKSPNTYPPLLPINPSVLARCSLLESVRSDSTDDKEIHSDQTQTGTRNIDRSDANVIDADSAVGHFRASVDSSRTPHYEDDRLRSLDISFWTEINITSSFAAEVISLYLKTDHPLLGLFDPDLFLKDLVGQQSNFCSKFLVHALLSLGCMYCAFDRSVVDIADSFGKEAERLWQAERWHDSFPTMAGAITLSLSHLCRGIDHSVLEYSKAARDMGLRLGLYDADKNAAVLLDPEQDEEQVRARCYAGWGLFNWNTLVSLFYRQPGSPRPITIPALPVPGEEEPLYDPGNTSSTTKPLHRFLVGTTFPVLCNFWRIVHGILWIYYPDQRSPPDSLKLELVEHKYRELLAWVEDLPPYMLRNKTCPHHVVVFHIWLHSVILDIFRPFLRDGTRDYLRLKTFTSPDSYPATAYAASVEHLKRLVFDYRTNYETSTYSILWHTGLLYLANAMLQDTGDPQWRLYFLLCIYGYESLGRPYRVSQVIVRGLLSMTLRDTDMSTNDARRLLEQMEEWELGQTTPESRDSIRATFMVDLALALSDPEGATVENMAAEFETMALFQDLLHQDKMKG